MTESISIEDAYRKWSRDLLGYATALVGPSDAADLVAEAFSSVLRRGTDHWSAVDEPRRYLFRSVLNVARQNERGSSRRRRRETHWSMPPLQQELIADPEVVRALSALSVQQRAVTFLTYWEDLSPASVAEALHISEGSVKRHLARARNTLREVL